MDIGYLTRASLHSLKQDGFAGTARIARQYLGRRLLPDGIDLTTRRFDLSQRLARTMDQTIAYGPFTGTKLAAGEWWGAADQGSMLLGIYEQEVLHFLREAAPGRRTFVDLGAADGYYAIGALVADWCDRAICFEASEAGRKAIATNAQANGVLDRVEVRGLADAGFVRQLRSELVLEPADSVVLIDIEGGEFSVLTDDSLRELSGAVIVVELHDFLVGGDSVLAELVDRAQKFFNVGFMMTGARDLSPFAELHSWPDDDRWLICSESRQQLQRWMCLTPR